MAFGSTSDDGSQIGVGQDIFLNTESDIQNRGYVSATGAGFQAGSQNSLGVPYAAGFNTIAPGANPLDAADRALRALMELEWACHRVMDPSYTTVGSGVVTLADGRRRWTVIMAP